MRHAFSAAAVMLIVLGTQTGAMASPDQPFSAPHDSRLREQMRAIQMEQAMLQRDHIHGDHSLQGTDNNVQSESAGSQALSHADAASTEEPRRSGRMSAEERRALRRQIDDAGHEIYTPR